MSEFTNNVTLLEKEYSAEECHSLLEIMKLNRIMEDFGMNTNCNGDVAIVRFRHLIDRWIFKKYTIDDVIFLCDNFEKIDIRNKKVF